MDEAARRWRNLVKSRLAEIEEISPGRGPVGPSFWDRRARRMSKGQMGSAANDPFVARLRRVVGTRTTLLDVGCGPGRFSLAAAPRAREVVAVDPSSRMLGILRARAREAGLGNVKTVRGSWEDVHVEAADVAICSYVLPLIPDVAPFLRKLDRSARRRVLVYLGAFATDAVVDPFWRHFHGSPRRVGPTYLDAVAVLREVGIEPAVEIVEVPTRSRFASVEDAVENYRDWLLLPDRAAVRRELASLLEPWLQRRKGVLQPPLRTTPAAILSWRPRGSAGSVGLQYGADA